ncbi:MAG: hypothetical protein IPK73_30185 [Candidatus Obscuribacter sp.]|jgi:hypothetical protein|nr:hypothetical protein [Candidatus Obscuribacter sp.]MBL8084870.1 hypothetical protein [Candidatus Obscuribacter sp.]
MKVRLLLLVIPLLALSLVFASVSQASEIKAQPARRSLQDINLSLKQLYPNRSENILADWGKPLSDVRIGGKRRVIRYLYLKDRPDNSRKPMSNSQVSKQRYLEFTFCEDSLNGVRLLDSSPIGPKELVAPSRLDQLYRTQLSALVKLVPYSTTKLVSSLMPDRPSNNIEFINARDTDARWRLLQQTFSELPGKDISEIERILGKKHSRQFDSEIETLGYIIEWNFKDSARQASRIVTLHLGCSKGIVKDVSILWTDAIFFTHSTE